MEENEDVKRLDVFKGELLEVFNRIVSLDFSLSGEYQDYDKDYIDNKLIECDKIQWAVGKERDKIAAAELKMIEMKSVFGLTGRSRLKSGEVDERQRKCLEVEDLLKVVKENAASKMHTLRGSASTLRQKLKTYENNGFG